MAGAFVQSFVNSSSSNLTSLTVTVSGATANALLKACIEVRIGGEVFTTPAGWTLIDDFITGTSFGGASYFRIADGTSADDFAPTWTNGGRPSAIVQEFSGLDSVSPLEASDEDESNLSSGGTTQGCGSATPLTANGMAVAVFGSLDEREWGTGTISIDSSYTNLVTESPGGANSIAGMASKPYSTTAAQAPTWSTSDVGGRSYGAISVFKEPAASGNTITANQPEAGDGQAAAVSNIVQLVAIQSEAGDSQAASLVGVIESNITANQPEAGDSQVAAISNVIQLTANQPEDGDSQTATISTSQLASITAAQSEAGDITAATVNNVSQLTANQSEAGDIQVASIRNLLSLTANQIEAGDVTAAAVSAKFANITASQPEAGDITAASFIISAMADIDGVRLKSKTPTVILTSKTLKVVIQ